MPEREPERNIDGEELPEPIGERPADEDASRDPDPVGDEDDDDGNRDVELE